MSNYLLAFRGRVEAEEAPAQEEVWSKWFRDLGPAIVDYGHRVGRFCMVGSQGVVTETGGVDPLTGYIVVKAEDLKSAVELANGCPILRARGHVEVGETFD